MRFLLLTAMIASFAYVTHEAIWGNVTSERLIAAYVAASAVAWGLTLVHGPWRAPVKWGWIALSLCVMGSLITGPLDYFRLG